MTTVLVLFRVKKDINLHGVGLMSLRNNSLENAGQSTFIPPPPRIIKIHGATKDTVRQLADKYEIDYEFLPTPRPCSSQKSFQQSAPSPSQDTTTSSGYGTSPRRSKYYRSSRDYYYYDPVDEWLCWCWLCLPNQRSHYRSYGYDREEYKRSKGDGCSWSDTSGDCDSSSDDTAGVIAILALFALVGLVLLLLPQIITISIVVIGLVESVVILLFDIVTLGIFHDELSRVRIAVYEASEEQMRSFYKDLAAQKALPDVPGLNSSGFMWLRVGAFLLLPSLIGIGLAFLLEATNRFWYWFPASIAGFSLACIVFGYLAILRKSNQVKKAEKLEIWW